MTPWQDRLPNGARPFLQPMAMILICTVFISLILVTGLIDLRRLDQTLVTFMENRGLDVGGKIQRDAQENFSSLMQGSRGEHADTILPFTAEAFLPQETFINSLVTLTRRIDRSLVAVNPGPDELRRIAAENHLWLVVLLNEKGRVAAQTRSFPGGILGRARLVVAGRNEISIDLFRDRIGSIALRRSSGTGTILVALDDQGLRYWGMKVALQKAVEDAASGQKLPFVAIMGEDRTVLASTGDLPDAWGDDEAVFAEVLKGSTAVANRRIVSHGRNLLEILSPVFLDNRLVGVLRIGLERDEADQLVGKNRTLMIISMVFIMVIGLLSIWFLYENQNRHLARMEEMRKELQKSERLSSLGQLAAGVAHEIRNPLNAISMASQRLQREFPPGEEERREEFGRITSVIRDEVRRLNAIIEEFLAFSRSQRLELREYSIGSVLQKLLRLVGEEAGSRGIELKTEGIDDRTLIPMDMDKLQQAFLNIIKNAMESICGEGTITVSLKRPSDDRVAVKIADTGSGLTQEEMDRIFNPEYTTKEKGLGLGLPIAHEIVRGHGGEIRVQSTVGSGTTFEVLLPLKKT